MSFRRVFKFLIRTIKRFLPIALGLYFIPILTVLIILFGLIDVSRNRPFDFHLLKKYFFGNGVLTWMISPFNLFIDLISLPFRNHGIFKIEDFPEGHQREITELLDIFRNNPELLEKLETHVGDSDRAMLFFRWYGREVETSFSLPGIDKDFKYLRTIGVSAFNANKSTAFHFGPFRSTVRILYNLNPVDSEEVFIEVGDQRHLWKDEPLFIFDDTLMHRSVNRSEYLRYCVFADIIRPSLIPFLLRGIVGIIQAIFYRVNFVFYNKWKFIK